MKVTIRKPTLMIIFIIGLIITVSVIAAKQSTINGINLSGSSECNRCHSQSHKGSVSFTVTLNVASILLNGTPTSISATVVNSNFPLSDSTLTFLESPDYQISTITPSLISIGKLGRGTSKTENWEIIPNVSSDKIISLGVSFSGVARDHKTYTYQKEVVTNVLISSTPTPILVVSSNPATETVLIEGETNNTGILTISNGGTLELTNVEVISNQNLFVDGKQSFIIDKIAALETLEYNFVIDTSKPGQGTVTVTYIGESTQTAAILITIAKKQPIPVPLLLGRIFGYVTYLFLLASAFTGVGRYHLSKLISGRKIRALHADLSNISFTMVVIHAMILTIPNSSWANSYSWFELLPEKIPDSEISWGLELGRYALVLMYISLVSGYYFAKIIKRFGRKVGIRIHMLSYISLLFGVFHAILIGGTSGNPFVIFLFVLSLVFTLAIKVDSNIKNKRKRAKRELRKQKREKLAKKVEAKVVSPKIEISDVEKDKPKPEVETKKEEEIIKVVPLPQITDARSPESKTRGVVCWQCYTLNDDDAIYCKKCASKVEGLICQFCQVRNDDDTKYCIGCGRSTVDETES